MANTRVIDCPHYCYSAITLYQNNYKENDWQFLLKNLRTVLKQEGIIQTLCGRLNGKYLSYHG